METFRCGHVRTPDNSRSNGAARVRCRTCHDAAMKRNYITRRARLRAIEEENVRLREQLQQCLNGRTP